MAGFQNALSDKHEHGVAHAMMLARHWQTTVLHLSSDLVEILDASSFCLVI